MTTADPDSTTRQLSRFRQRYKSLNQQIRAFCAEPGWATDNDVVMTWGPMLLRRFVHASNSDSTASCDNREPLLIVYSHVNHASVIDLEKSRSLIQTLQQSGHDVYLLEWQVVKDADCENDLAVYINHSIDAAVQWLLDHYQQCAVNLMGICQGGTFSLCYASMYPQKVSRLVTLVTPVDFHAGDNLLAKWVGDIEFELLEQKPKNVSGYAITMMFQAMRPFDDMIRQVQLVDSAETKTDSLEFAVKLDQWVYHCPDQPGRAFAQFCRQCFQDNALCNGTMKVGDNVIDPGALGMPVLNVYASRDHLVPPASSTALGALVNPDNYQEISFNGGHIGLLVSQKALQTVAPEIGKWLVSTG